MSSLWSGEKVCLRGIEPDDWHAFMHIDKHSADMRTVDKIYPPRSAAGYQHWVTRQATQEPSDDEFQLAIESRDDNTLVGALSTTNTDQRAGRFSYGIGIGREYQRRGYATDAITLLLTFMFGERRYHKCSVGIYAFNSASVALHHKLGFETEGHLREHEYFAGRHHDVLMMGLTINEFAERHAFPTLTTCGHTPPRADQRAGCPPQERE